MKGTPIVQLQARFINMFEGLEFYYKPKKKGGGYYTKITHKAEY